MSDARHCDGPRCNSWQMRKSTLPNDWIDLTWHDCDLNFCTWDCCMKYGAGKPKSDIQEAS